MQTATETGRSYPIDVTELQVAMETAMQTSEAAIFAYTYGMDTGNWDYAVSHFADEVEVDYSAVGMTQARMSKAQLSAFLAQLLGKPNLHVHTAVSQVFASSPANTDFVAYYSVRHYKGELGKAEKFAVFGWYTFHLHQERIDAIKIHVSAMEGNPAVLA